MNRRDMFKSIAGITAASGVPVQASAYEEPTTKPALAVLECAGRLTSERVSYLYEAFTRATEGTSFDGVKVLVLQEGMRFTLIDKDGHVLNRTVEDAPERDTTDWTELRSVDGQNERFTRMGG